MSSAGNQYQDIYGRWHAPLMNAYNNYCWFITGLQRLQCSGTLETLLKTNTNVPDGSDRFRLLITQILQPIRIINKLNGTNGKDVVDELRKYFEQNSETYHSTDGFSTNIYLSKYILPIIFNLSNNDINMTIQIMKEIGMNSSSLYVASEVISDDTIPIMKAAEDSEFYDKIYRQFKII